MIQISKPQYFRCAFGGTAAFLTAQLSLRAKLLYEYIFLYTVTFCRSVSYYITEAENNTTNGGNEMEEMTLLFPDSKPSGEKPAEGCPGTRGRFPNDTPIGMAYVPYQFWEKPYDEPTALSRGTIFPALDKPFIGEEAVGYGK